MSTLQERINFAFERLPNEKRNQSKLAAFCGVKPPSANDWFTGETKSMKAGTLAKAAEYLNVSEKWLRDGKGPIERFDANTTPAKVGERHIPLLSYIEAGQFTDQGQPFCAEDSAEYLPTHQDLSDRAFALKIRGDSMLPLFESGDVVIIDCNIHPLPGDYVVAKNGSNEATFKRYKLVSVAENEVFELVPLNENYPTMRSDQMHIEIIGVMVEHRKFRKKR